MLYFDSWKIADGNGKICEESNQVAFSKDLVETAIVVGLYQNT